ncbi:MAG: hypothetical protein IKI98_07080 [Spirochaetaceae bacterium]|nr:hypothetical protein [Spirochaetaceae bacterium]
MSTVDNSSTTFEKLQFVKEKKFGDILIGEISSDSRVFGSSKNEKSG